MAGSHAHVFGRELLRMAFEGESAGCNSSCGTCQAALQKTRLAPLWLRDGWPCVLVQLVGDSRCLVFGDEWPAKIILSTCLAAVNRDTATASRSLSHFLQLLHEFNKITLCAAFKERVFSTNERPHDTRRVRSSHFLENWRPLLSPELRDALTQQEDDDIVDGVAFTEVQAPTAKPYTLLKDFIPKILGMVYLVMVIDHVARDDAAGFTWLSKGIWPDPGVVCSTPVGKKQWNLIRTAPTGYSSQQAFTRSRKLSRSMSTLIKDTYYEEPIEVTLTPDRHPVAMLQLPHASSAHIEYHEPYVVVYNVGVSAQEASWKAEAWFRIQECGIFVSMVHASNSQVTIILNAVIPAFFFKSIAGSSTRVRADGMALRVAPYPSPLAHRFGESCGE